MSLLRVLLCCAPALAAASEQWADGTATTEEDCQTACYSHEMQCSAPDQLDKMSDQVLSCYQCCQIRVRGQLSETECKTREDVGLRTGSSGCGLTLDEVYEVYEIDPYTHGQYVLHTCCVATLAPTYTTMSSNSSNFHGHAKAGGNKKWSHRDLGNSDCA